MRRMHTKKEIEDIAEESGVKIEIDPVPTKDSDNAVSSGGVFDALLGKVTVLAKTNNLFTPEELEIVKNGVFINGTISGAENPILFPSYFVSNMWYGMAITHTTISMYRFAGGEGSKEITILHNGEYQVSAAYINLHGEVRIKEKDYPNYPENQGGKRYNFALNSGSLAWIQGNGLYLHTIEFAVSGSSDPLTLTMVSDSTTPVLLDTTSGNFLCPNAKFIQFVNCDSFLFARYGANGFNPDIRELDTSTGAFSNTITLTGVNTDTISTLG